MAIAKLPTPKPPILESSSTESAPIGQTSELRLDRQLLLELLSHLRATATASELRAAIKLLQARLANPADALHAAADAEAVRFASHYLLGELAQIDAALTLDRAKYYLDRLQRAITAERMAAINEINLNRWKEYDDILTDSLWLINRRDSTGVHSAGYWGNFIPQIPNQLMRRYTRRGDWVIDPFGGSGTTLIEGQRLGRNTLGVELQPHMVEFAQALIGSEPNPYEVQSNVVQGDSAHTDFGALLEAQGASSAQLAILHPPYHDIIQFSDDPRDLSNAESTEQFLELIGSVVKNIAPVLENKRYLALVIGDKYHRGELSPLGFLAMNEVQKHGFTLKSIVVKNIDSTAGKRSQKELWRYRALVGGFYVFKHEYVFVFRKGNK